MNEVSRTTVLDTPASRLRAAVESTGYTIEGLRDNATEAQVLEIAEDMVRQIKHYRQTSTPASSDAVRGLQLPLNVINESRGTSYTIAGVAQECGVDMGQLTMADVDRISAFIGGTLMAR